MFKVAETNSLTIRDPNVLSHPTSERRPIRPAVVFIGERVDAHLRDHGYHQSRPWQLLHGGRVSRLLAREDYRQSVAGDTARPTHRPCHWCSAGNNSHQPTV